MKKLFYLVIVALFLSAVSFASFPVKMSTQSEKQANSITVRNEKTSDVSSSAIVSKVQIEKAKKGSSSSKKSSSKSSSKDDLVVLLLLWFFLGFLAAHRWYAGKPAGWNILFILTAGGCGIWAIIDLINIITGKF
jgi:hypothetical protein